jgi:hypothetical protein
MFSIVTAMTTPVALLAQRLLVIVPTFLVSSKEQTSRALRLGGRTPKDF